MKERVVRRFPNNPILTREDVPYSVATVHNAGVVKTPDGRYVMLFRSHRLNGRSIIGLAESDDGLRFRVANKPFLVPTEKPPFSRYEEFGVEDLRISAFEDTYWLTYSGYSRHGVRVLLARTEDFRSVERVALFTECDTRNVVLFPGKFDGKYVRLQRPHTEIGKWSIWASESPDLIHWGQAEPVLSPTPYHWTELKVGPGATPFACNNGWLHVFHGVYPTMAGNVYRLGVALHDLDDPRRMLAVSDEWILEPEDPWERSGYVPNVVFSCGAVAEPDNTVKLYWGGADTVMCAGQTTIAELVSLCESDRVGVP